SQSGSCPTGPSNWKEVFNAKDVENGGRKLIVFNKNAVVEDFFYTLRVWNGTDWLELDPGAGNQNGGEPFTFESVAACAITGGIVGLGASMLANNLLEPSGALVFGLAGAVVGLIVGFVASRF
ncbi:MAG TPA: hypothetical protein VNA29_06755, partial [Sphingomicrobium sp.]|nr:hypothetical protein [Sphingomicrobium sp.]